MKFIQLEILNLASLDRTEGEVINFEEGVLGDCTIFSIVGPTGSGKSTILDAICLALYNRAPRYPRKKGDRNQNIEIYGEADEGEKNRLAPTDARNILTRGKTQGHSRLTFLANNGIVYRAEWSVRKLIKNYEAAQTSLFKITMKDGVPTEEPADWNQLPQIIGLDYDQFLRTVLIAQGSFSSFIRAKENERYELLEKLIGCEELYTNIAAKIKQQKDEAVKAYDQIAASLSIQEKDIIPEDELAAVKERMAELDAMEKQTKAELLQVAEAIAWYTANEQHLADIEKYTSGFNDAKRLLDALREQTERLALHDATIPATALYKDIQTATATIARQEQSLKVLGATIAAKAQEIKVEEEVNLARLKQNALDAAAELERQKPRINEARRIKTELEGLNKALNEKRAAKEAAEKAKLLADKNVADNVAAVAKAEAAVRQCLQNLSALQKEIEEGNAICRKQAEEAQAAYSGAYAQLEACDAGKLQEAKAHAEKMQTDLKNAVRIQEELRRKRTQHDADLARQKQLNEQNALMTEQLKAFDIEKWSEELDTLTKSYTLMTSEKWEQHRADLVDGEACPLCGALHHPYHDAAVVAPVVDDMKRLIDEKRNHLNKQRDEKQKLTKQMAENSGVLEGLRAQLKNREAEFARLDGEWAAIHAVYGDWPADAEALCNLCPEMDKRADEADRHLKAYNDLCKRVEKLRKVKETAEMNRQAYEKEALEKVQVAEKQKNAANTMRETERGKTENLTAQQKEKAESLVAATDAWTKAQRDVASKAEMLKQAMGDKDPDLLEKELETAQKKADEAVKSQTETISRLHGQLKEAKGQEDATKKQKDSENEKLNGKKEELARWLSGYNEGRTEQLTETSIALLCSATDDWESIRATQKRLTTAYTSAETTLNNARTAYGAHQKKKPEKQKEELLVRKAELDNRSNAELVELKARLQRHETAKTQMGVMFDKKQEAELRKREWEEITEAIGSDGKTLRKIAQCYTLRFLIEHANVEIRKFNTRYELQQVKNSLGIRVVDHDRADDVRDVTSLSGGETFIVSLGLALGLSSLSSRNISFENLFIDEGFGTLDPDSLATVIDALAMLQSSQGKKVGVISHTDTMSERITTQIRIIKNGNSGSSHIEIYP
ncbi:MAG: AAA family ATPase [Prevotellaceae bacterium]|nr:AAA family ATPase [Prevotellaceae bacterium]